MPNLNIRCTDDDRALIQRAADVTGKTLSAYVLDHCCMQAKMDILDQRHIILSPEAYDRVIHLIENPKPNPALVALMSRRSVFSGD